VDDVAVLRPGFLYITPLYAIKRQPGPDGSRRAGVRRQSNKGDAGASVKEGNDRLYCPGGSLRVWLADLLLYRFRIHYTFLVKQLVKKSGLPLAAVLVLPLLWSCAGTQPEKTGVPKPQEPAVSRPGTTVTEPESRDLQDIPQEAREYLAALALAFSRQDLEFLISQGEKQYEAELKSYYDDGTYLAMLYRVGPYTEESPWRDMELPRLEWQEIKDIEYDRWSEKGPLLEIQARLIPYKGKDIPCEILLIWRLEEPKIQGAYP
jgi:hypothetical protein